MLFRNCFALYVFYLNIIFDYEEFLHYPILTEENFSQCTYAVQLQREDGKINESVRISFSV